MALWCYIQHKIKQLFTENVSKNSNFDDSGIFLPALPSRSNLRMYIPEAPTLVKKVITNLDASKASCPDCIPVVVLQNYEPELAYMLAEHANMCFHMYEHLKTSQYPNKVSTAVYVFENVGERSVVKNYNLASFLPEIYKPLKTCN